MYGFILAKLPALLLFLASVAFIQFKKSSNITGKVDANGPSATYLTAVLSYFYCST